jgi:beta-lactam-binding protein with PASTA domain
VRVCQSCGRENPDDRDFCECGEYLRWEPTSFVPAVSAPTGEQAAGEQAPAGEVDPNVTVAADAAAPGRAWGAPAAPGGLGSGVAPMPGTPGSGDAPPGAAALMLRLPDDDSASPSPVRVLVNPGEGVLIVGLIRNQSEVVDNFDMSVRGLPEDWWTITPATAYLVPYGSGGTYEQEIQVQIHPPRAPQSQARPWPFEVVAESRAYGGEVASSSATATVGPYFDVATELRPERASGRLKARYRLVVRNKANARTEVALSAEDTDAECQFRFAEPKIALEPGNAMECPFTVLPPKQIWVGKPHDRQFQVTAAPVGVDTPSPPRMAVFRQRPWLPWWLAIVVPVIAALAILAIKLMPKQAVIPNLKGQPSMFAAQKLLNKDGFVLAPKPVTVVDASKPAGSIADQSPAAGTKAKKGTPVTVKIYTGTGKATVPNVVGDTPGEADQALRASSLALGTVSPQPLNPKGKISSQIPLANASVPNGTSVAVFLASASGKGASTAAANGSSKTGSASGAAAGTAAAAAAGAASVAAVAAQAGKGPIPIPSLTGDPTKAAAQLSQLGLVPHPVKQLATVPIGQVAGTIPAAGSKVAKGALVDLIISNGSPQLSYDNGQTISVINPSTDKPSGTVPAGSGGTQVEAAWSPDGTQVVYSQNGELVLDNPNDKSVKPFQLTAAQPGVTNVNPSFAPTNSAHIIAFIQRSSSGAKLCFATIGKFALNSSCTSAPGWDLGGQVAWAPGGQTILVLGTKNNGANFGLLAFNSNVAFSTQGSNWGQGTLQTNDSVSGQGVFAGAFSPNGKKMALVSNIGTGTFNLYIVPTNDFTPNTSQELPGSACQVAWRSDSQELAVMQPSGLCSPTALGTIVALNLANPRSPTILTNQGAHPAWQPVPTGG